MFFLFFGFRILNGGSVQIFNGINEIQYLISSISELSKSVFEIYWFVVYVGYVSYCGSIVFFGGVSSLVVVVDGIL